MKPLPHDKAAERAVIGSSILSHAGYERANHLVRADQFYVPEHARIFAALHQLEDVGGFAWNVDWNDLEQWPITWPLGWHIRAGALATLTDLPVWAFHALAQLSGDITTNATRIVDLWQRRHALYQAEAHLNELSEANW